MYVCVCVLCDLCRKPEDKEQTLCAENQEEDHLKKPRRKDTPVLNSPPHIPGRWCLHAHTQVPFCSFMLLFLLSHSSQKQEAFSSFSLGVKLLKVEKQMVHLEDEEKDVKN
uniref:Uncharacterized protein n=1 Tax=Lates calcarifer TaxID=8187 RepID=A0A4W6BQI5_LATCA